MEFNALEHAGWQIVGYMICMILGACVHWLFRRNNCRECGISELRAEISRLSNIIELLAEKVGLTVKERKEIESYHI